MFLLICAAVVLLILVIAAARQSKKEFRQNILPYLRHRYSRHLEPVYIVGKILLYVGVMALANDIAYANRFSNSFFGCVSDFVVPFTIIWPVKLGIGALIKVKDMAALLMVEIIPLIVISIIEYNVLCLLGAGSARFG